jgi:hypothetical protein
MARLITHFQQRGIFGQVGSEFFGGVVPVGRQIEIVWTLCRFVGKFEVLHP